MVGECAVGDEIGISTPIQRRVRKTQRNGNGTQQPVCALNRLLREWECTVVVGVRSNTVVIY